MVSGLSVAAQGDFTHLSLFVSPDTQHREIAGAVYLNFVSREPVDSLWLDGIRMSYQTLRWNDQKVKYDYNDQGIWLQPTASQQRDTNRIFISYRCRPRKGLYFVGWRDSTGRAPRQIWTQGQGIDHRHWIPHRDDQRDKMLIELNITFDDRYHVMANGQLTGRKTNGDGTSTWAYRLHHPMSSYLIALAIGRYDSTQTYSQSGKPLIQYYYPEREEDYAYYYFRNEEIFDFLEAEIGIPYPWSNYKQAPVRDFRHGAMENTAATIFGDFFLVDSLAFPDRNYTYVNAHEAAHQWFGNWVTATGSAEHWLHEGFATYYQWLSEREIYGVEHFHHERLKARQLIAEANAADTLPLGHPGAGSSRFYQKGAWVLHMLHQELGRAAFRQSIQRYLREYGGGLVTTDSLAASLRAVTGKDFKHFFKNWVQRAGEPRVRIEGKVKGKTLQLEVRSAFLPFATQIPLKVVFPSGDSLRQSLTLDSNTTQWSLPLPEKPVYWTLNPGQHQLLFLEEEKPASIWRAQYRGQNNLPDRLAALEGLRAHPLKAREKLLRTVARDKTLYFALRAEALAQLVEAKARGWDDLLYAALDRGPVALQKEVIALFPEEKREEWGSLLARLREGGSYELRESALHASVNPKDREANRWLYDTHYREQPGIPGEQLYITALTYRVLFFRDREALHALEDRLTPAYDFLTRLNAMDALSALKLKTPAMLPALFDALFDPNWKLRGRARTFLQTWYATAEGQSAIDDFRQRHSGNWEDFQKRLVERTFEAN